MKEHTAAREALPLPAGQLGTAPQFFGQKGVESLGQLLDRLAHAYGVDDIPDRSVVVRPWLAEGDAAPGWLGGARHNDPARESNAIDSGRVRPQTQQGLGRVNAALRPPSGGSSCPKHRCLKRE
ncbi:hypothetical protein GCM10010313_02160 [Streptomyces violarus]|uniref:Uncharacterized protein n=1 Tax=Streptomyces violarus TaxID=67380 RepID=A0A7W4ZJR8_9ACTN|nr:MULTISPECIES: hypothetical protein [Streptomyces]MBB3073749.1 hypothetical protein [Streptomyces violarus]WRU03785.1 hypothetical protein VJ737_01840 [Streptomyces sp. CGMCC 4.1772]GHC96218.1 hypothetical protein GCM10010313_02160 [Streptomyces violarus]